MNQHVRRWLWASVATTKRRRVAVVLVAWAGLTIAGCSNQMGDAETDRITNVVTDAIVYPRPEDAAGLARAALATRAGQDGRLEVLEYTDLSHELTKPRARLMVRVHHDGAQAGFSSTRPVVACYSVTFDYYTNVDGPSRIDCPTNAHPVTPPPAPPIPPLNPSAGG